VKLQQLREQYDLDGAELNFKIKASQNPFKFPDPGSADDLYLTRAPKEAKIKL